MDGNDVHSELVAYLIDSHNKIYDQLTNGAGDWIRKAPLELMRLQQENGLLREEIDRLLHKLDDEITEHG